MPNWGKIVGMDATKFLLLLILLLQTAVAHSLQAQLLCESEHGTEEFQPQDETLRCSKRCSIRPWEGVWGDRRNCTLAAVLFPKTEQELVQAVAEAVRQGRSVKVSRGHPHSTPKLTCPASPHGLLISTANYDKSITIDAHKRTATLGAGAQLHDLLDALADAGLGLPAVPVWSFLSVVGLASTGAHGSSFQSQVLHDRILSLRLVIPASPAEGHAKVLEIGAGSDPTLLAAARLSLGVLGAISQITLQADPILKRKLRIERAGDSDLPDRVLSHAQESEFGEIFWFPSQHQAVFLHFSPAPLSDPGNDSYTMATMRPVSPASIRGAREVEESIQESGNRTHYCEMAGPALDANWPANASLEGLMHRMQSSQECAHPAAGSGLYCSFEEPTVWFHETSFTIPVSGIEGFVRDVAALRDARPQSLCQLVLYYGFWLRYVKGGSEALLGEEEDAVDVNFVYFRARKEWQPRLDEDVLEEIEQLAMGKYQGKPHWGKSNRFVSFLGVGEKFGETMREFVAVKRRLDPAGVFSSPWTDALLGLGGTELNRHRRFCALDGRCICEHDEHCNPDVGYFCQPGLVYPEARVCRFERSRVP